MEHENWRQQRFASQEEGQFCRSPKTCRKPFVIHVPLSDLVYLHIYLGMLYFAVKWCFILAIWTAIIKRKQHFEKSDLTQLHLEAYHRLTFPTHQMEVGEPLETCTENLIPRNSAFPSLYWLNRGLSKIPPSPVIITELTEKAKVLYLPGINHSTESPILLQVYHLASLEPGLSHGSGLLWCIVASLWEKGRK